MPTSDRPQIRPGLAAAPANRDGDTFLLWDEIRISDAQLRLSAFELKCIHFCDGTRTINDLRSLAMTWTGGQLMPLSIFEDLLRRLDEALFLDNTRYRERVGGDVRPPSCIGCYEGEPKALRKQLRKMFTAPGASGLPEASRPDDALRAVLVPHIDYARGGRTYTHGFREIVEHSPAELFVIIGTSHYSRQRFTLTRKHFQTPLGIARTDRAYVDQLVQQYGDGLFDDEVMAHLPEHSIELEVVLLQFLFEGKRDIRIVPLVVGSFHDAVVTKSAPRESEDIGRMIDALRAVERDWNGSICYLISGDLAHIGPKFGDGKPVDDPQLKQSKEQDQAILQATERADPAAYFDIIAQEKDRRRICGLPPTYTVLEALRPGKGRVLDYDQYVHPRGHESVSFASVAFYR